MTFQTKAYRTKLTSWEYLGHIPKILGYISILFILTYSTITKANTDWRSLDEGIEYIDIGGGLLNPWSHIHVFRIDLKTHQLSLVMAEALSQKNASIHEYAYFSKALLAINGGFFNKSYQPLGLRINHKKQKNPIKRISWWGIFYINSNTPHIKSIYNFSPQKSIDFAIQSGPRLIINNAIPSLKPGAAERTALGITKGKKIIILVTDKAAMTTLELAKLMRSEPLSCTDALNLDGGSSSQLHADIDVFKLSVHGFSNVSDAVVVTKK